MISQIDVPFFIVSEPSPWDAWGLLAHQCNGILRSAPREAGLGSIQVPLIEGNHPDASLQIDNSHMGGFE